MRPEHMCGVACWHPKWLQRFANTNTFLMVYGLLGTIQSMAFLYFVVTLTTMEKRFKIPSQVTGKYLIYIYSLLILSLMLPITCNQYCVYIYEAYHYLLIKNKTYHLISTWV